MNLYSGADPAGPLFFRNERLYREISSEYKSHFLYLLNEGIFAELNNLGLIPRVNKASISESSKLVLEIEIISPLTYSHEWTFDMYKDAAKLVLTLRQKLLERKLDLKDVHPENIGFDGTRPVWLDVGSIVRQSSPSTYWSCTSRFLQSYVYVLKVWCAFGSNIARRINFSDVYLNASDYYSLYGHPLHFLPIKLRSSLGRIVELSQRLASSTRRRQALLVLNKSTNPHVKKIYLTGLHLFQKVFRLFNNPSSLYRSVDSLHLSSEHSEWGNYSSKLASDNLDLAFYDRFLIIAQMLVQYNVNSLMEIGCNNGDFLSVAADHVLSLGSYIGVDIDHQALNSAYLRYRSQPLRLKTTFALADIMNQRATVRTLPLSDRCQVDCVLALAVTHHLVLRQYNSLSSIFSQLRSMTTNLVMVEFMPYGLWSPSDTYRTHLPREYSETSFREAFVKYFKIEQILALEPHRILYIGSARTASSF